MLKKQTFSKNGASQPIELICQRFGKNSGKFRDPKIISKLLAFIQKRKAIKKKQNGESKGGLNSIAKGIFAALTKKNPILNQDEMYNCLQ